MGRTTITYLLFGFLQRGMTFLLLPFVTRVMTPQEYGGVSVVVAGGALFSIVFGSALESAVFRWTVRKDDSSAEVLRISAFYLYLILPAGAVLVSALLLILDTPIFFVDQRIWAIEVLACGLMPVVSFYALPFVRARNDLRRFVVISSVSIFCLFSGKLIFVIILGQGLFGWVISDLIAAIIGFAVSLVVVRQPRSGRPMSETGLLLRFALPLIPHRTAFWALTSLSRPAMAAVIPLGQVGIYALGFNFSSVASMVLVELNRALLAEYSAESFPAPGKRTRTIARLQIVAAVIAPTAVGAIVAVASPLLIGAEFSESIPLIAILMIAQSMYGMYLIPANYTVQTAGHTRSNWISSVLGACFIFISILVFGFYVGMTGIAFFTAIGYLIMAISALVITYRIPLKINWSQLGLPRAFTALSLIAFALMALALCAGSAEWRVIVGVCSAIVSVIALVTVRGILKET